MDETRNDHQAGAVERATPETPDAQRSLLGLLAGDVNQVAVQAATVGVLYGAKKAADKVRDHGPGDKDTGQRQEPGKTDSGADDGDT